MRARKIPFILICILVVTETAFAGNFLSDVFLKGVGAEPPGRVIRLNYRGFTVIVDCAKRGAILFRYNVQRDTGNYKRSKKFRADPKAPKDCQQWSYRSYRTPKGVPGYDRGHLVPANHMDSDKISIYQTNFMTNILPQAAAMNRGAWYRTEKIIECYRDRMEIAVYGGPVWGRNWADDYFVKSHGVRTPDAYWKILVSGNGRTLAWVVPNDIKATKRNLDKYVVTIPEIERLLERDLSSTAKQHPDVKTILREIKYYESFQGSKSSWPIPKDCHEG